VSTSAKASTSYVKCSEKENEDCLDIDIDIDFKENNKETTTFEVGDKIKDSNTNNKETVVEKCNIEETSRNPKRKSAASFSFSDERLPNKRDKIEVELSEEHFGNHMDSKTGQADAMTKKVDEQNSYGFETINTGEILGSMKKELIYGNDDCEDKDMNGKKYVHNTTFSQVEEVIELDSDGEDPAYQSWSSSQVPLSTNKATKVEMPETEDSYSVRSSFDSVLQLSPKDEFIEPLTPEDGDNQSDDDVIFLESDNKELDLEGSQMALFEKIRLNIKIKKEKVDSQEVNEVDIINLASPPRSTEVIITLSPDSFQEDEKEFDVHDYTLRNDKQIEDKVLYDKDDVSVPRPFTKGEPLSSPYLPSPFDELPDIDLEQQIDRALGDSPDNACSVVNDTKRKSGTKIISPRTSPMSSPTKRHALLIDALPLRTKHFEMPYSEKWLGKDNQKHHQQDRTRKDSESIHKSKNLNSYSYVGFSIKDKEKRAEALKEIELKKKENKVIELDSNKKSSNGSSRKSSAASSTRIKNSRPKLAKLLPSTHTLKEVDLFGDKPSSSSARQPVRKAHNPKLPLLKAKEFRSKSTSKNPSSAVINSHLNPSNTLIRKIAETTTD
jgi:hypothetical protein